jgi:hypothetical protein
MGRRIFQTAKSAYAYAKSVATQNSEIVKVIRFHEGWIVESHSVIDEVDYQNLYTSLAFEFRKILAEKDDVGDIIDFFNSNLQVVEEDILNLNQIPKEDIRFLLSLPNILEELKIFEDLLQDINKPNTKEYALDMSFQFDEIAESLSRFKIAEVALKNKRLMLHKSKNLKTQNTVSNSNYLRDTINELERNKGKCSNTKCDGRWVLRNGMNGYFWGCSNFPKCFKRMGCTKEELEKLQ